MLAEHVRDSDLEPFSKKLDVTTRGGKPASITDVFSAVRDAFDGAAEEKRLPGDLARNIIDRDLSAVFEYVRRLRNESGHPTGKASPQNRQRPACFCSLTSPAGESAQDELKPKGERHG